MLLLGAVLGFYFACRIFPSQFKSFFRWLLGDLWLLIAKGGRFLIQDLGTEATLSEDGIVIRPLLPFGFGHVAVINGPDGNTISEVMNAYEPKHRQPLIDLLTPVFIGLSTNTTDASYLFDSSEEGHAKRQRTLVPYLQNPERMEKIFNEAIREFRAMFSSWTDPRSIMDEISRVTYRIIGKNLLGFDNMPFEVLQKGIAGMEDAINHGSIPTRFAFLSRAQQTVLEGGKKYEEMAKTLLTINRESILSTDNYTGNIVRQCARNHNGEPKDFILHGDVISSSPTLFLGFPNISTLLSNIMYCLHTSEMCDDSYLIENLINEVKKLPEESLKIARESRLLDKTYLEGLRMTRPAKQLVRFISKEMKCGNRVLPANTLVCLIIDSVLNDKKYWGADVSQFRPGRFDNYSNIKGQNPKQFPFVPFSLGIRSCPGYVLPHTITLAFLIALFDGKYDIVLDVDHNPPLNKIPILDNLVRFPPEFKAQVKPRNI